MAIIAPAKRINPTVKRRTGFEKKGVYAGLYLTSMVDMFAIMVIFLLQSFSAEGELIILPKGLELPEASNTGTLERAPSLIVSLDRITLEDLFIAGTPRVAEQAEWAVPKLQTALKAYRERKTTELKNLGKSDEEISKELSRINISGDRRLPFQIVKKVFYNAGFAGFPDARFAVFAGSKDAPAPTP